MLGSFNNCNIIQFTNEKTSSEDFDTVHKLGIGVISENMASLVQLGKYGAINASYPISMGYYVIKYLYEPYTIQEYQTTDGEVSTAVEPVVKSECLSFMEGNWYWRQHGTNQIIIISTRSIFHQFLEVLVINNVADIPSIICNKNKHCRLFRDNQFAFLMHIMIRF